jgi:hypothetical protein
VIKALRPTALKNQLVAALDQRVLSLISATYDQFVKFDFYELEGVDAGREFIIIDIRNWKVDHEINLWVTYSEGQLTADQFGNRLIAKVVCKYANESSCSIWFLNFLFYINKSLVIKPCIAFISA